MTAACIGELNALIRQAAWFKTGEELEDPSYQWYSYLNLRPVRAPLQQEPRVSLAWYMPEQTALSQLPRGQLEKILAKTLTQPMWWVGTVPLPALPLGTPPVRLKVTLPEPVFYYGFRRVMLQLGDLVRQSEGTALVLLRPSPGPPARRLPAELYVPGWHLRIPATAWPSNCPSLQPDSLRRAQAA